MIPKMIHYCWFGPEPIPEIVFKCVESWKKYCPDFEIYLWNETNYDINKCDYVREAYKAKQWAFVSDYARFDILNTYGGIYFDGDVELIAPITPAFVNAPFMAIEKNSAKEHSLVNTGLGICVEPNNPIVQAVLDYYNQQHFVATKKITDCETSSKIMTTVLKLNGFVLRDTIQIINGICIYPSDFFCPMDVATGETQFTKNTIGLHHSLASWLPEREKRAAQITQKVIKEHGVKAAKNKLIRAFTEVSETANKLFKKRKK